MKKYIIIDTQTGEFYHSNSNGTFFASYLDGAYEFDSIALARHEMQLYTCFDGRTVDIIPTNEVKQTAY